MSLGPRARRYAAVAVLSVPLGAAVAGWAAAGCATPESLRITVGAQRVTRDGLASERASGVVAREPEVARVVVEKMGFTQVHAAGGITHVAYGLELVNRSYDLDALDVSVTLRFLGAHGRSLARGPIRLDGVPANTTFYVGGRARIVPGVDISRLSTTVTVRASRKTQLVLPVAADIRLGSDRSGRLRLTGKLTSAYTNELSRAATVYAVIFDGSGSVIGGGAETIASAAGRAVPPGQTIAFELKGLSPTPARRAVFAGVSIEP